MRTNNLIKLQPHELKNGQSVLLKYDNKLHRGVLHIDIDEIPKYHFVSFAGFNIKFTLANIELETIKLYRVGN